MGNLDLIDPANAYRSASSYSSPNFSTAPSPSSGNGAMYASMGLSAIGSIVTTFGQVRALRAQGDYEESVARANAVIARIQSKQALEAGDVMAARKNFETQSIIGTLKARQGASGTDVASGSNALVRNAVSGAGAMDELTIRNNAMRQAWGYETEAINDSFKGEFSKLTAKSAADQAILTGGLKAIEGPLAIESNYLRWSRYMGAGSGNGVPFPMVT